MRKSFDDELGARVNSLLRRLYGRSSERINPNQLVLALAAMQSDAEPDAPAVPTPPSQGEPRLRQKANKDKRRGRKPLPPELPRQEIRLLPTQEQLAQTSGNMSKVGEERSEVLEYVPGQFKVLVYMRETWSNLLGEIVAAPATDKVIDKSDRQGASGTGAAHPGGRVEIPRSPAAGPANQDRTARWSSTTAAPSVHCAARC
jgi:hypothetical protein